MRSLQAGIATPSIGLGSQVLAIAVAAASLAFTLGVGLASASRGEMRRIRNIGPARRLPVVAAAAILALALAVPAVAASSPRSGDLHVTKECSQYTGAAGGFCTITSSNINEIKVGSRVVYAQAADFVSRTVDSDITIVRQGHSTAYGHVILDLVTGTGTVTFSGGTGEFLGFTASADVTHAGGPNWAWDGTYSFSPPN